MRLLVLFTFTLLFTSVGWGQHAVLATKLAQRLTSQAEFPGGDSAMNAFIYKNLQYPRMELDNDIQGKVIIRFI